MKSKENTPTIPSHWPRLIAAVERPESVHQWAENLDTWKDFLTELRGNALFPLAYSAWKKKEIFEALSEETRMEAEKRMVRHRASMTVMWQEIDNILQLIVEAGLEPVLLKGSDLAIRYYPEPYLRPLSDADLLFSTLNNAADASQLLKQKGFLEESSLDAKNPWRLSQHLPTLVNPSTSFLVDLHGSLIFPPLDRRWIRAGKVLMEEIQSYKYKGMDVRGLKPEAAVVYLSAHMFGKHGDSPKASVLYDLKSITDRVEIDWKKVENLAIASGFAQETSIALRLFEIVINVDTEGTLRTFQEKGAFTLMTKDSALRNMRATWVSMFYSAGFLGPVCFLANMMFLPTGSLRKRYPKISGWPSVFLHFVRFGDLAWKSVKVLAGIVTLKK